MTTPTPTEWQDAVDWADVFLTVDSAVKYGLITGGPGVDIARCEKLLARGAELGYRPADDAIERLLPQWQTAAAIGENALDGSA